MGKDRANVIKRHNLHYPKRFLFLASLNVSTTVLAEAVDPILFYLAHLSNSVSWTYKNTLAQDELKGRTYTAISQLSYLCN